MRKFLVKHFVLGYSFKIFGRRIWSSRVSRILAPSYLIGLILIKEIPMHPSILTFILMFLLLLTWIGFRLGGVGYFCFFPVKWNELDNEQKYYMGKIDFTSLQEEEQNEWHILKHMFE